MPLYRTETTVPRGRLTIDEYSAGELVPPLSLGRLGRKGSAWGAEYHDVQRQKGQRQNKEERDSAPYLGKLIETTSQFDFINPSCMSNNLRSVLTT